MVTKLLQAFQVAAVPERAAARHRKRNQRGQDPCKAGAEVVARYDYGNGRFKVRYAWQDDNGVWAKDFRWVNKGGAGVLLYRPPTRCELRTSAVFIVEGEKDVDRLRDAGFVATCTSEGSLTPDLARKFAGAKAVAVLRDYDEHGERVRTKATAALEAVGVFAFPVDLPGLKETANRGKDVSDWLDAGGTARRLKSLVIEAAR
jgi:5S rRNA maturation endonuclease (ribonuclease M5)